MTRSLQGQAVISGIGQTEFSKFSGRSELQLAAEASKAAIDDAGLHPSDIDGMVTYVMDSNPEENLMQCLGIPGIRYWSRIGGGGSAANATVQHAATAIASGAANHVLIYRAFNERSGMRFGQPRSGGPNLYSTFGLDTAAKTFSLWYQRYMFKYGVTNADFGMYSVVARRHAATNPKAWFYQRPITIDDHQNSRWIVEPVLRLLDCCQESDGGVALIVSASDRAADLKQRPVRVVAAADSHLGVGRIGPNYYHDDIAVFSEARVMAQHLFYQAQLKPGDIDVVMIYENFSPIVFLQLEALGFCGLGEARDFIAAGNIGLDGSLPVNTNGGLLGEAYIHGVNNILEAVRQIRGTAANQVKNVEHAVASVGWSAIILGA
jgi:acetyl-CoA acetyltransferase